MMMNRHPKRARKAVPVLSILTPIAALVSVVNVAISMSTSNWLDSYERIPLDMHNSTNKDEFMVKRTISGLWKVCSFNITEHQHQMNLKKTVSAEEMHCTSINYLEKYIPDPNDSTNAIPNAVTKAGPLFIFASGLLAIGILSAAFGHRRKRRISIFVSGIIFIVAGLILLIGLVVYLSVLQAEIGPKLRPKNAVDAPQFFYTYGFSFIMIVVGFMSTELTGTCAIFYYIYWHQVDWEQKHVFNNITPTLSRVPERPKTIHPTIAPPPYYSNKISSHQKQKPFCQHFFFDDLNGIPIPPPPPHPSVIPRDLASGPHEDFFVSNTRSLRGQRRMTPV